MVGHLGWDTKPSSSSGRWLTVRWGIRLFALAAPVPAWLMWRGWNDVPWWQAGEYLAHARNWALAVVPCEWLTFQYLGVLSTGSRLRWLPPHFYAGRYAAVCGALIVWLYWPPDHPTGTRIGWADLILGSCCPGSFLLFTYPMALLVGFAAVAVASTRSDNRLAASKTTPNR